MKKKRILSILLALVLIVSALPMTVFAAGEYSYIFFGGGIHTDDETATEALGGGTATWDAASATLTLDGVTTSDYISLEAVDPSTTFTLVLKGTNRVEYAYSGTAIYSNANLNIVAEEGASLYTKSSDANAIYVNGSLSFSGGSYELASAYPPVCADGTVNISGAAQMDLSSPTRSGIYASGLNVTGEGVYLDIDTSGDVLEIYGPAYIENATLIGHCSNDWPVYVNGGDLTLINTDVTLTADVKGTSIYTSGNLRIEGGVFDIDSPSIGLRALGNLSIVNAQIDVISGSNPISADGALIIDGADTVIESTGPYPVIGDTVEIKNGQVTVSATEGTAICGSNGVTISGGAVSASTTANMSAIYAESGNIVLDGAGTSVTASSTGDSAIFTRNGAITLNAGSIHATAPEGSAAFTARFSGQSDTSEKPESLIIIGENFAAGDSVVATTVWKEASDGTFYADTMLVPADTQLNEDGLLPEDYTPSSNDVTVTLKPADYTAVDAAITKAQALNKDNYSNYAAVEAAVAAVERGLDITRQADVDAMAKAIEDAVAALTLKGADYTAVDAAIAKAEALVKDNYSNYTAVETAIAAVVRDLDITRQADVDAMAKAIEDAVAALTLKGADYTAVDAAIAKAEALDKADYSNYDAVETAIAAVVRDLDITRQADVDAMAKAIEDAIAALTPKKSPVIIEGANATWKTGSKSGLTFRSDAEFADFLAVKVDGKELDKANYTVKEGSTVVTLSKTYLSTLALGSHTLEIVSENGTAKTTFTIAKSSTGSANQGVSTGDSSNIVLWIVVLVVAAAAAVTLLFLGRKKRSSK